MFEVMTLTWQGWIDTNPLGLDAATRVQLCLLMLFVCAWIGCVAYAVVGWALATLLQRWNTAWSARISTEEAHSS